MALLLICDESVEVAVQLLDDAGIEAEVVDSDLARVIVELKRNFEDSKIINRAERILMDRLHLTEREAHCRLQKIAASHRQKSSQAAASIIAAEQVFMDVTR